MPEFAVVMGITQDWARHAYVVLRSLADHAGVEYDVILYHDGLASYEKDRLRDVAICFFEPFNYAFPKARIHSMSFARFECFHLLGEYDRVLWLDADVLVLDDVSALFTACDAGMAMWRNSRPTSVSLYVDDYPGLDVTAPVWSAGVALFAPMRRHEDIRVWCYEHAAEGVGSDQGILSLAVQRFGIPMLELPVRYNAKEEADDTAILHYRGQPKLWDSKHPVWTRYAEGWS